MNNAGQINTNITRHITADLLDHKIYYYDEPFDIPERFLCVIEECILTGDDKATRNIVAMYCPDEDELYR